MGNITIALENEDEKNLRGLARKKFMGRKGSISKVVAAGIRKLVEDDVRENAKKRLSALMSKRLNFGGVAVKDRSELYGR